MSDGVVDIAASAHSGGKWNVPRESSLPELLGEDRAAGADERDLGHGSSRFVEGNGPIADVTATPGFRSAVAALRRAPA